MDYVHVDVRKLRDYAGRVEHLKKNLELEVGRMDDGLKSLAATCEGPAFDAMKALVAKETESVRSQLDALRRRVQGKLVEEEAFVRRLGGHP